MLAYCYLCNLLIKNVKSYVWKIQVVEDTETGEIMEWYRSTEVVLIGLNVRTSCKPASEARIDITEYCTTDFKKWNEFLLQTNCVLLLR